MKIHLKGMSWNHSRGYLSVAATAQRFMEMHPNVEITWDRRSLQQFADFPIEQLISDYDLLVIDHPWAGFAATKGDILVPLEQYLPGVYLANQEGNSVGQSHSSYNYNGYQTALAIDAAAPVATYRPDLFRQEARSLPQTWNDLLTLAYERKVVFAGIPIDLLMQFFMLCATQGERPCVGNDHVVSNEMGVRVLEQLKELVSVCPREMLGWNPILVYEAMSTCDDFYYCPFAYGYSNYSRRGYSKHLLLSTDLVTIGNYGKLRSTLGGAGIAISTQCGDMEEALKYVMFTASPEIQKTIYFDSGGQPGHREAWLDSEVNRRSHDFFSETLPALDRAYVRPRYKGYFHFQDQAGEWIHQYMRENADPRSVLDKINQSYRESKRRE